MFWVHDKFRNRFDNLDGSGWPDYPAKLVWPKDPDRPDRPKNPNRLGIEQA